MASNKMTSPDVPDAEPDKVVTDVTEITCDYCRGLTFLKIAQ